MPPAPAAKYAPAAPATYGPGLALGVAAVLALRLWRLPEAGLPDYDSVRNWQVIQELAQGNFAHLFHHGSPGFVLLYVPVAWLTREALVFQVLNALLGVAGLGWFAGWVSRTAHLGNWQSAGLVLLGGTSLLLTFSGRDFTMSSGSLLILTGLLSSYFRRLRGAGAPALLRATGWLAAGLCFNYKFLFALPILGAFELWWADELLLRNGLWLKTLALLAAPYGLLSAVGAALGLPWYRWLGFYYRTVVPAEANAAGRQATLRLDLLYYPRYLLDYEPMLLLGLLLALVAAGRMWWRRRGAPGRGAAWWAAGAHGWRKARPDGQLLLFLLGWVGCLLLGMSLLIKAPRGLLFAYLPLAALLVLAGHRLLPGWGLGLALAAGIALNVSRLQQEIYARLPTRYPRVAAWLRAHGATRVGSTVSLGLAPYLADSQQLTVIDDEHQLADLRRQGYSYVLLDGYWRVAGIAGFDSLLRQPPIAAWPEPKLTAPLLFLEHSEFTGLGYAATLAAQRAAAADTAQLRLYRLR